MHLSKAVVRTEHASRYLQQLCKHWSHKFSVDFDPVKGRVPFSDTAEVTFSADDAALTMTLSVADPAQQQRMHDVIDDHLKRFAFREELDIVWTNWPGPRSKFSAPNPGTSMTKSNHRESEYPIDPMFLDRWSPRAFTGEIIEEAQLLSLLEAAHWAPSSANHQPWRFIYALKGSEHWEKFVALLVDANQEWARNASALIFVVSRAFTGVAGSGEEKPSYTHSFDAGAAWGHLAIQARLSGFYAHGMGGIKHEEIRQAFAIPEGYRVEAGVAVGKLADKSVLSERNQAREFPSQRKPLSDVAFNGRFAAN